MKCTPRWSMPPAVCKIGNGEATTLDVDSSDTEKVKSVVTHAPHFPGLRGTGRRRHSCEPAINTSDFAIDTMRFSGDVTQDTSTARNGRYRRQGDHIAYWAVVLNADGRTVIVEYASIAGERPTPREATARPDTAAPPALRQ